MPGDRTSFDFADGNHGTFQNGATYAAGMVGEAFNFSGANYVSVPDNPTLNPTNPITVECWLYRSAPVGGSDPVIKKAGEGSGQVDGYALEFGGDAILFYVFTGSWSASGGARIDLGQWNHVAGVYDGTNLLCYVNGSLAGSPVAVSGSIIPSSNPLRIGSDPANPGRFLNGKVDEISIYNRALSASEIQAIYAAGGAGKCKPPHVTATIPQNGATQVATTVEVRATFSEPMDATALNSNTFLVIDPTGNQVPGTVSYQAASTQAVFTATAPLALGSFYSATVKSGVRAISGMNTVADYTWVFCSVRNEGAITARTGGTIVVASDLVLGPSSVLNFVLAGTQPGLGYGQVTVTANVAFDGMLGVTLTNGFAPAVGDTFAVLSYGSRSGAFRRTDGLQLSGDPFLQLDLEEQTLLLVTKSLFGNPPPPATNLVNQVVAIGGTATFHIEPLGQEPFSYQWRFNGSDILGSTTSTLTITNVQPTRAGTYSVVVTDGLGAQKTYSATLTVLAAPVISTQPVSQVVAPGTSVNLSVTASGDGPLQYQWRRNGANIPGETNATFAIPNARRPRAESTV